MNALEQAVKNNLTVRIISGAELQARDVRLIPVRADHFEERPSLYELHRHDDCYEIFWLSSGSGEVQIDFQKYAYSPHSVCLISPGQIHGLIENQSEEPPEGFILVFSRDMLAGAQAEYVDRSASSLVQWSGHNPFCRIEPEQSAIFRDLFRLLERELSAGRKYRKAAVWNYVQLLLIEIGRAGERTQEAHREEAGFLLTKQFLALVEAHFHTVNGVSEYASRLHVTPSHLIESVKKTLGKSAGEVLQERKLLEAKRLLRYSKLSIRDIALRSGYQDPSYFGRFFKKRTGATPIAFRKQN